MSHSNSPPRPLVTSVQTRCRPVTSLPNGLAIVLQKTTGPSFIWRATLPLHVFSAARLKVPFHAGQICHSSSV